MPSNHRYDRFLAPVSVLAISLISLASASCGVQKSPHYSDKTFGQEPSEGDQSPQETPKDSVAPVIAEPIVAPAPAAPDLPEDPEPPTNQILSHYGFEGYFNLETTRRILHGPESTPDGNLSEGGWLDNRLSDVLSLVIGDDNIESLQMRVNQHGVGHNEVTQDVNTDGGDHLALMKGEDSQSGTQTISWALAGTEQAKACPNQFVCIDRMTWVPKSGETKTYCYVDHETQKPVSIPYSPNSNFSAEAFAAALGTGIVSSPIDVITHPGNVVCDAENIEILAITPIQYNLILGDRSTFSLKRAVHKPLSADAEIIIAYSLLQGEPLSPVFPKTGPYVDQLTRLNSKVSYFINTAAHVLVKIDRTTLSPLKIESAQISDYIRNHFGDLAAIAFELAFPPSSDTEGVHLVYSFEFCTHLAIIPNYYNHCTGQITE